jgi:hypothetical protein
MGRIAVVPLQKRRNQGSMGSLWFTIGFVFFVPVMILLGGAWFRNAEALLIGGGAFLVFGCVLLAGAWALFVVSLYAQMDFASAPLLPGHVRHLQLTLAAGVVACCALVAAGFGLVFGLVVTPAIGALVILTGILVVMRWGWLGMALAAGCLVLMSRGAPGRRAWLVQATQALIEHGWIASATTTAVCVAVLWWLAPAGRRPIPRSAMPHLRDGAVEDGVRPEREAIGPAKERDAPRAVLLHAWWRGGRLPPETGSPLARALSVLPLNLHWPVAWMWQWRRWLLLVAVANLMDLESLHGHADLVFLFVASIALTSMADEPLTAAVTLHESRREQAFVALLPGVPHGSASGRWLALQMTANHAMTLLLGAIMLQVIGLSMAHSGAELSWIEGSQTLLVLPLACVPFVIPLWSRRATMKPPSGTAGLVLVTLPLPLAAAAALACHQGWLRVGDVAILLVAPTALWCLHRWRRMGAEPGPFPVGRLAR